MLRSALTGLLRALLLFLLLYLRVTTSQLSSADVAALEVFYAATGGSSSWYPFCKDGWLLPPGDTGNDPCLAGWYGVTCNAANTSVKYLELQSCGLAGTIPRDISVLNLNKLNLAKNYLQGSFPVELLLMSKLHHVDISQNNLNGTFPAAPSTIRTFRLQKNHFSGAIPHSWTELSEIEILNMSVNAFTGTTPDNVGSLGNLHQLDLSNNQMTGSIPPSFSDLHQLEYLSLSGNELSGHLYSGMYNMNRLADLDLSYNRLSGGLSSGIYAPDNITSPLRHVYLSHNRFTSTIPAELLSLSTLILVDLSNNYISGTIAPALFSQNASHLLFLYLQANRLHGSIPDSIGNSNRLMHLFLFENALTGTLPESMRKLSQLQTLLLQDNELSGQPGNAFKEDVSSTPDSASEMMRELLILDLSNNLFSGEIPTEIFQLPKITYVSITEGCFEGSIPHEVCDANTMTHLILEGMSSGRGCYTPVWDPLGLFANGIIYNGGLTDGVPSCLFELRNLTTLHLSGNGLDGSINLSRQPNKLKDLSLSYNQLSGSIPTNLLQSSYSKFDLSNNKITGTCDDMKQWARSDTGSDSLLNLALNRLSGNIPKNFRGLEKIDILQGNVFNCPNRNNDLPRQDPAYLTYICASDDYDEMLIIWSCFWLFFLLVLFIIWGSGRYLKANSNKIVKCVNVRKILFTWFSNVEKWCMRSSTVTKEDGPQLYYFLTFLTIFRKFSMKLSLLTWIFCSMVYVLLKVVADEGTHTHQYRWIASAAYLSGTMSATLLIICFVFLIYYTFYNFTHIRKAAQMKTNSMRNEGDLAVADADHFFIKNFSKDKDVFLILCGFLANAVVVLLVNGLYVYAVSWQDLSVNTVFGIQAVVSIFDIIWDNIVIRIFMKQIKEKVSVHRLVRLVLAMLLFNNIIAPILSTLVTDINCFYGLFVNSPEISTISELTYCAKLAATNDSTTCEVYGTLELTTSYLPKFQYNYQCSSSFLANFIPIYVLTSGTVTFLAPMMMTLLSYLVTHKIPPNRLPIVPPRVFFPGISFRRNPQHIVFTADMIIAKFLHNIAVILTFGVACPNLAFIHGVHIFVMTYYYHIFIGRYLCIKESRVITSSGENNEMVVKKTCVNLLTSASRSEDDAQSIENDLERKGIRNDEITGAKSKSTVDIERRSQESIYMTKLSSRLVAKSTDSDGNENISSGKGGPNPGAAEGKMDVLLEEDCRDIIHTPEMAVWTILDVSCVCIAMMLVDISGDVNGFLCAFLTASLPVLCIPILFRTVDKCYHIWTADSSPINQKENNNLRELPEAGRDTEESYLQNL